MKENEVNFDEYKENYSEENFWEKVKKFAGKAGAKVIYAALKLYYALMKKETPAWAKGVIIGALGYFISPIDLIPDAIPVLGFTDDLPVLAAAIVAVSIHITDDVKAEAKAKLSDWFGSDAIAKIED